MNEEERSEIEDESLRFEGLKELTGSSNGSASSRYGTVERKNNFDFKAARERLAVKIPSLRRYEIKENES